MTKTCQILVEGEYNGILKPYRHYIPIKKDFSDIDEALIMLKDKKYCQNMIDTAYEEIVQSGNYTYRKFVKQVIDHIKKNTVNKEKTTISSAMPKHISLRNHIYSTWRKGVNHFIIDHAIKNGLRTGIIPKIKKNKTTYRIVKKLYDILWLN